MEELARGILEWRERDAQGVSLFNERYSWYAVPLEERIRFLEWRLVEALGVLASVADAVVDLRKEVKG